MVFGVTCGKLFSIKKYQESVRPCKFLASALFSDFWNKGLSRITNPVEPEYLFQPATDPRMATVLSSIVDFMLKPVFDTVPPLVYTGTSPGSLIALICYFF